MCFLSFLEARQKTKFHCRVSCRVCCQHCQTSKLQTAFPLANEQRMHPFPPPLNPPSTTFSEMLFPSSVFQPTPFIPPPLRNWTLKCRHANQALIHLKLTGRPDYDGGFLLQTSYQHHLYRNTCRNMKELPSSISQSIVCRMCQQTEGKLSYTHLSPGVKATEFAWRDRFKQTNTHSFVERNHTAHSQFNSSHCHFLVELLIFGY